MNEESIISFFIGMAAILFTVLLGMVAYGIWEGAGLMGFVAVTVFIVASKVIGDVVTKRFDL